MRYASPAVLLAVCLAAFLASGCASAGHDGVERVVTVRVRVVNDLAPADDVKAWLTPVWGDPLDRIEVGVVHASSEATFSTPIPVGTRYTLTAYRLIPRRGTDAEFPFDRARNEPNAWRSAPFTVKDTTRTVAWHLRAEVVEVR